MGLQVEGGESGFGETNWEGIDRVGSQSDRHVVGLKVEGGESCFGETNWEKIDRVGSQSDRHVASPGEASCEQ